jgi:hypothetical protein
MLMDESLSLLAKGHKSLFSLNNNNKGMPFYPHSTIIIIISIIISIITQTIESSLITHKYQLNIIQQ